MKQEMHFTEELGRETQSGNEICPVYLILKKKKTFIKVFYKKVGFQTVCNRLPVNSNSNKSRKLKFRITISVNPKSPLKKETTPFQSMPPPS